jgi:Ca-activated chloride channel family protein
MKALFKLIYPLITVKLFMLTSLMPHTLLANDQIELVFTYGSEKENWITAVTKTFNQGHFKITSGKVIQVTAIPMGSGEATQELLEGKRQAHLCSPASTAFIELANAESADQGGKNLIGTTQSLVRSPVVIAMWKPMAEALGWGKKPIGWAEILNIANQPEGWAAYDYPEWGKFKFGHTHPKFSNSGLISLLAEVYAGSGKTKNLTVADVNNSDVRHYVETIEKSIVHYGSSTGFFGDKMFTFGPAFLSATVLYENLVIDSYNPQYKLPFPIVAIYPQEGTFWSDHPIGVVERKWVTEEHRQAAKVYIDYLLAKPQQEQAISYGFRPADNHIQLTAPLDEAHGVNPTEPTTWLEVPPAHIIREILTLWNERKKHTNVVLALDISGSMMGDKLNHARQGALKFLQALGDSDNVSLLTFNHEISWLAKQLPLKTERQFIEKKINNLFASGNTALYDAIIEAYQYLKNNLQAEKIAAIVVLSDGQDTSSQLKLEELLKQIQLTEATSILIFPIGYGEDADKTVLANIANETKTKVYQGTVQDVEKVFLEISTFF